MCVEGLVVETLAGGGDTPYHSRKNYILVNNVNNVNASRFIFLCKYEVRGICGRL